MSPGPRLTRQLARAGVFDADPFVLADAGASGGLAEYWRAFEPQLHAFGFELQAEEVRRLNEREPSPQVRYFEAELVCEGFEALYPPSRGPDPTRDWSPAYERSSAMRAERLLGLRRAGPATRSAPRVSLDAFFAARGTPNVDFLKVDTDGHDYEVLYGARRTLAERGVLGVLAECQLHGPAHPHASTFANTDRLLRELGFTLFDLDVHRYTRAPLPGLFAYAMPAQTVRGPVVWADALYALDPLAPGGRPLAVPKLLKLLCIFEIFALPDCAAELLLGRRAAFETVLDVPRGLDELARQIDPGASGFQDLNQRFERSPAAFFPAPAAPPAWQRLRRLFRR